ncbi:MAG: hypothetical protein N2043_02040 [Ignavibacterium sp.]|nr:hypothetical protein [Ignavibacterium sp.]
MTNIPSFRKDLVRFRGQTSSHQYNESMENIFYDIVQIFNILNEQEKMIEDSREIFKIESHFQNIRNLRLLNELEKLKEMYEEKINGKKEKKIFIPVSKMEKDMTVETEKRAEIDVYHGVLTLPIVGKETSKVYLYDEIYNEIVYSDKLDIKIDIDSKATYIEQNDPKNMCNGDNTKYWKAKCIYTSAQKEHIPNEVDATITIHLPENILTNRQANAIYIHPFPHNSLTIKKVEYRLEGGWRLIPGWKVNKETNEPEPIKECGNIKLVFPPMNIGEIRLTISQPTPIEENSNTVFYLGMQEVGVVLTDYQSDIGYFQVPIRLRKEGDNSQKIISKIIPHFKNEDTLSDNSETKSKIFQCSVYTVEPDETLAYTKDSFPILINRDRIVLKCQILMDKENQCSPALEWIKVIYEDR